MRRAAWLVAVFLFALSLGHAQQAKAPQGAGVNWIWLNQGDPAAGRPVETVYFRRTFIIDRPVQKPVDEGTLDITADNEFTVWVNGVEVGKGNDLEAVYRFDVKKHLVHGKNVIAVEATNTEPARPACWCASATCPTASRSSPLVSDGSVEGVKDAPEGWQKLDFDDSKWAGRQGARPLRQGRTVEERRLGAAAATTASPCRRASASSWPSRIRPANDNFSLVNMTLRRQGPAAASRAKAGPILLCTEPDKEGRAPEASSRTASQVKNCQGMCWVKDALLLVGDGPQGTGLYRCRDTKGDDKTDEVKLLHKFKGGMGEHGPHAIIHGPDDWLYLVIGNHAWAASRTSWPTTRR